MGLGSRIRIIREAKGKSQQYVAETTGLSQSYISSLESGVKINPTRKTIEKIALAIEVDPEVLTDSDSALPQEILNMPQELVGWVAKEENVDYILFAKETKEQGLSPEEASKVIQFYRNIMKSKP